MVYPLLHKKGEKQSNYLDDQKARERDARDSMNTPSENR